ncbi:MAG: Rrf2 family transcriptional regulator [Candidatus Helarchaeota archaeon]|nr:Rrf2 family transcriptional regulator [Candidatus Helarchaeota archaeon]
MKLTVRSEYALLALIYLSKNYKKRLIKIEEIAKEQRIPKKYLEQILLILKRSGYLRSKRGAKGGYKLAKSPEDINIAEIVRLMDGPIAPVESVSKYFYEPTPIEKNEKLRKLMSEIRKLVADKLEETSFSDLL